MCVQDEICKSVTDKGGLELVMKFITTSREQNHKIMARSACLLLIQLSSSDTNKNAVVQQLGGLPQIVDLISHFSQEASVVQEALTAVAVLTRSPVNAGEAVKSGVVDVTAEMMDKHTGSPGLQRQACQLIRNLAVRNLENRNSFCCINEKRGVKNTFVHLKVHGVLVKKHQTYPGVLLGHYGLS
ncbi:unnamed protein product [Calypogeia fissa]